MSWPDLFNTSCYLATVTENTRTSCIYWLWRSFDETLLLFYVPSRLHGLWYWSERLCLLLVLPCYLALSIKPIAQAKDIATNWIKESFTLYQWVQFIASVHWLRIAHWQISGTPTIEPVVAGLDTWTLPLCYPAVPPNKSASVYAVKFFNYWSP